MVPTVTRLIMRINKSNILCTILLAIVVCAFTNCGQHQKPYEGSAEARPFTQNLPSIDRVELMELERVGDLWNGGIKASKVIEGTAAQQVASLWRTQTYLPDSPFCHFPAYAIKFFLGEKLIAYASLCWECDNIEFLDPKVKDYLAFGGKSASGRHLLSGHSPAPSLKPKAPRIEGALGKLSRVC